MKMRASATLLLCLLAVAGVFAAPKFVSPVRSSIIPPPQLTRSFSKSALRSFFELIDEDGNGMVTAAEIGTSQASLFVLFLSLLC
jgi:hypothetical protein